MTQDEQGRGFRSLVEQIQSRGGEPIRDERERPTVARRRQRPVASEETLKSSPARQTGTASRLLERRWL
jgi:hypothetical protein